MSEDLEALTERLKIQEKKMLELLKIQEKYMIEQLKMLEDMTQMQEFPAANLNLLQTRAHETQKMLLRTQILHTQQLQRTQKRAQASVSTVGKRKREVVDPGFAIAASKYMKGKEPGFASAASEYGHEAAKKEID